jgi:hypothetical protein
MHDDPASRASLLSSAWVASWLGAARLGQLHDPDQEARAAAWAYWAVNRLTLVEGQNRKYPALVLPGTFYDPKGNLEGVIPHLEISKSVMERSDPLFPYRLAQFGNAATFPNWTYHEITAVRRCLFSASGEDASELMGLFNQHREQLRDGLVFSNAWAASHWTTVADAIISTDDGLSSAATGPFSPAETAQYLPGLQGLNVRVEFDEKLRISSGSWASRRVGVWRIRQGSVTVGVATPRLTRNSLFVDKLFSPDAESAAALFVRGLLLRRICTELLPTPQGSVPDMHLIQPRPTGYLRASPARNGQRTPEASVEAAVEFLRAHDTGDAAWATLETWAERGYTLAVTQSAFISAYAKAVQLIDRAEEPPREEIDVLLPLAWHSTGVVRVTWATNSPR